MGTSSPKDRSLGGQADDACAHCGLPLGAAPVGTAPAFCCTGCATVYAALRDAGFGEAYYRLRDMNPVPGTACPAPAIPDDALRHEYDSTAFLDQYAPRQSDGMRTMDLFLDGVHCAACVWLVERLPFELSGVAEARLDLPRARLRVRWDGDRVALTAIVAWLARFGYHAQPLCADENAGRTRSERALLTKMGVCWALAGNVMLLAFALYAGLDRSGDAALVNGARWLSLLLAMPAVLYGGAGFFKRAWASVMMAVLARDFRRMHMDTPIALGILAGFGHSAWATVSGSGEVWFDSVTVLIAALLTARWLQLRSRRLAGDAAERLLNLIPSMARRIAANGQVDIVLASSLRPGDLVEVPVNEVFPVDGAVATGESVVNNAVLTGESKPVAVSSGDAVHAGATNLSAPLQVQVQAAGDETRVGALLSWVREGERRRAPVVLLANRLSGYFVLVVLALAVVTALFWWMIAPQQVVPHVIALLVITCPCALGMATPLAMAVAAGRAARIGIYIKRDEAVQQVTAVDTLVLDKTGTLTNGVMSVVDLVGDAQALSLAARLEAQSNHPVGLALHRAGGLNQAPLAVADIEYVGGQGIRGRVGGQSVAVGRPSWIEALAATPSSTLTDAARRFARAGHTPVSVAVDGHYVAAIALGDPIRQDAGAVVGQWQRSGKAVYLLSGDHADVVASVGAALGIEPEMALGDVGPEAKQAFIERLTREGRTVAMVGDGVNDAGALQAAAVGIAVHGSTTASLVAADIFLTRSGVGALIDLFDGSRAAMRVVRRNLGLSLVYNLVGAAAAMAGMVSPLLAAIAMPLSSLVVVTSSILQGSFRHRPADRDQQTPPLRTDRPASSRLVARPVALENQYTP